VRLTPNLLFLSGWYRRALARCHRLASGLMKPRGKCGVWSVCRVADVCHCADWSVDSLADMNGLQL
jgi:hypothetical protein